MPSVSCSVVKCTNHSKKLDAIKKKTCERHQRTKGECGCLPYQLFPFPKHTDEKELWVMLVNRQVSKVDKTPWQPSESSRLCSDHFVHGYPSDSKPLPIKNMGYDIQNKFGKIPVYRRAKKLVKSYDLSPESHPLHQQDHLDHVTLISDPATYSNTEEAACSSALMDSLPLNEDPSMDIFPPPQLQPMDDICFSDFEVKPRANSEIGQPETNLSSSDHTACLSKSEQLEKQIKILNGRIMSLSLQVKSQRSQLRKSLAPVYRKLLKSDADAVFYTGLPNLKCYKAVVQYYNDFQLPATSPKKNQHARFNIASKYRKLTPSTPKKATTKLCTQDKILMVLMKLRLGLLHKDLADR